MNLLTDAVFRVQLNNGADRLSLPGLMAALGRNDVDHLVGIQRHQADAFHVFICSLAAMILARRGDTDPIQSDDYWHEGLRDLARDAGDDAWRLLVDDLSKPAFMQPPLPPEDHGRLRHLASTPDTMDVLVTSKNHDNKRERAANPDIDSWIYALMSLQTMNGFSGRDNPGISRMNSGYGNRSICELTRSLRLGIRWIDAVQRLLHHRQTLLSEAYGYDPRGVALVWLEPWDGRTSLPLSTLDPLYVEICRRVRLRCEEANIYAEVVPSPDNRIAAKDLKGVVGDAWLPIDLGESGRGSAAPKALTIAPQGLTPTVLRRLIFEDQMQLTALQKPMEDWKGQLWFTVSVLVRGQGITEGFYEAKIEIPPKARPSLFESKRLRESLANLSKSAIDHAAKMQHSVLRPAIFSYMEGAPEKIEFGRDSAQAWWRRFARRFETLWAHDYFPWLWDVPDDLDQLTALDTWARQLRDHALTVLREAKAALPKRAGRYYRASVRAERVFWGALYHENNFPSLKEERHERTEPA